MVEEATVELLVSRAGAEKAEPLSTGPLDESVSLLGEMMVALPRCTVNDSLPLLPSSEV